MRPTWRRQHNSQDLSDLREMRFSRELFYDCQFKKLKSTIFEHCSLQESRVDPENLNDILGVTLTLDCFTFEDVHWNPLAFEALLYLMTLTKGNDEKREILRRMIHPHQLEVFDRLFKQMECRR